MNNTKSSSSKRTLSFATAADGTEVGSFARRVYEATRQIPAGSVATYGAIARRIGAPKAVRAVGTALGKNPFLPEVPCHRVVRSDGGLGGYALGLKKKIALLEREGVVFVGGKVPLSEYAVKW